MRVLNDSSFPKHQLFVVGLIIVIIPQTQKLFAWRKIIAYVLSAKLMYY